MPERSATNVQPLVGPPKHRLDDRIAELRAQKPVDINHGEALMLQGLATASLREQRIPDGKISLEKRL